MAGPLTSVGQGAPPAFHLLAKPTGPICNLDCEYCFFLSKEMLYPDDRFRMADDLLETYILQLLEAHRTPEVTVAASWWACPSTVHGRSTTPIVSTHADWARSTA